jgi:hypothetical protein
MAGGPAVDRRPRARLASGDKNGAAERERLIVSIADDAASRLAPSMLAGGKLTFPQESFVVTASLG